MAGTTIPRALAFVLAVLAAGLLELWDVRTEAERDNLVGGIEAVARD